jgi:hypothetical protein
LLAYLGEAHIHGTPNPLKEYTIGRDVMGKPADYDPRVDSSVRVQIGKLRQRLEEYYRTEAVDAPVKIRLPKGQFDLVLETSPAPLVAAAPGAGPWKPVALAAVAVAVGLAGLSGWLWTRTPAGEAGVRRLDAPALREFWGPFLDTRRPLTLVMGSPLFIRFSTSYYRDPNANDWETARKQVPMEEMTRLLKAPTAATETRRWVPFGEATAAVRLTALLAERREEILLKRSSSLSWEDVRQSNLVFLGPPKFNPQLRSLPVDLHFAIEGGAVRNREPKRGEAAEYKRDTPPEQDDIPMEYALVTRLRGLEGWGEVLVLESTTTEGTWAAADFVTEPRLLQSMLERVKSADGRPPACYQVLLRSRFKAQVPLQTEYVTHHSMPGCGVRAR